MPTDNDRLFAAYKELWDKVDARRDAPQGTPTWHDRPLAPVER